MATSAIKLIAIGAEENAPGARSSAHCKQFDCSQAVVVNFANRPVFYRLVATFIETLEALIDGQFDSKRAFLRAVDPAVNENSASAYLSLVLKGERPVPDHQLERWADVLGLAEGDRQAFIEEGYLSLCPEFIVKRYRFMQRRLGGPAVYDARLPSYSGGDTADQRAAAEAAQLAKVLADELSPISSTTATPRGDGVASRSDDGAHDAPPERDAEAHPDAGMPASARPPRGRRPRG